MVVTSTVGTLLVLGALAIVRAERVARASVYYSTDNQRLLIGVVFAVVFPVLVLAATVGRLAARLRDRRMANLRLLGMGGASVRLAAAVEAGTGAVVGCALGVAAFPVLRWGLGRLTVAGVRWPIEALAPWLPASVVLVVALPLVVVAVAALPQRLDMSSVLARARRHDARRPSWLRGVPLLLGASICVALVRAGPLTGAEPPAYYLSFFLGLGLLGLGVLVVVPVFVRLLADLLLRLSERPTVTIAARRLQAQPAIVTRVVSGLLLGVFLVVGGRCVLVAFEDTPQYLDAQVGLTKQQTVTVDATAAEAGATEQAVAGLVGARSTTVPTLGVCSTIALPAGDGRPPSRSADILCEQVLVLTCPELHRVQQGLRGCRPDTVMRMPYFLRQTKGGVVTVVPTLGGQPIPTAGGIEITTTAIPTLHGTQNQLDGLSGGALLLPPSAPGVADLVAATDRSYVVTSHPGRDLGDRLAAAGIDSYTEPDYANVDFVSLLRTMLWTLASVIVSIGLLGFAIAAVDRAVARRSEVTSLQLVGVPPEVLRRTQWLEAALPIAVGGVLAALVGMAAGATYLSLAENTLGLPWTSFFWVVAVVVAGAGVVAALTVVASTARISPDHIRRT